MEIPINSNTRALIFDLDGTLANTMPAHIAAWTKAANHFGAPMTEEMVQKWAGMASLKIVNLLNEQFKLDLNPKEVSEKKAEFFFQIQGDGVEPIQEIYDIAKKYKDQMPMGIGTGSRRPNAEKILKALGIRDWFSSVVTANDVDNHKPAPDTYLKCAKELNIEPMYCQVFEDADFGVRAAKSAGMHVIDIRDYIK